MRFDKPVRGTGMNRRGANRGRHLERGRTRDRSDKRSQQSVGQREPNIATGADIVACHSHAGAWRNRNHRPSTIRKIRLPLAGTSIVSPTCTASPLLRARPRALDEPSTATTVPASVAATAAPVQTASPSAAKIISKYLSRIFPIRGPARSTAPNRFTDGLKPCFCLLAALTAERFGPESRRVVFGPIEPSWEARQSQ